MPFTETFPFFFYAVDFRRDAYRMEIHNADGGLVYYVREPLSARLVQELSQPARLTFSVLRTNRVVGAMSGDNEVWVYRDRGIEDPLVGKFTLWRQTDRIEDDSVEFVCYDALAQWAREYLLDYTATDATIATILAAAVAAQVQTRPLTLGTVDASISVLERSVDGGEEKRALRLLDELNRSLPFGSHVYVDGDRALGWSLLSDTVYAQIYIGRNAQAVERTQDNTDRATRVYPFGVDSDGARVRLTDGGAYAQDYINDTRNQWSYRKQVVWSRDEIPHAQHGATNVGLTVTLTADTALRDHARSDGGDIAFFSAAGDKLNHQLVSYTAASGALTAYVRIPTLSATLDTVVYMHFGAGAIGASTAVGSLLAPAPDLTLGAVVSVPGAIAGVFHNPDISDTLELYTWGLDVLRRRKNSVIDYRLRFDLNSEIRVNVDEQIVLGARAHIVDGARSVDTEEYVVRIERDLLDPTSIEVDFSALEFVRERDPTTEAFSELDDKIDRLRSELSEAWSDPRVDDWEYIDTTVTPNAGNGQIDGDEIEPGTIGRLAFGAVTQVVSTGPPQHYKVRVLTSPTKASESPELLIDAGVPDDALDVLVVGASVAVWVPSAADIVAGQHGIIVLAGGAGGTGTAEPPVPLSWAYNSWANQEQTT